MKTHNKSLFIFLAVILLVLPLFILSSCAPIEEHICNFGEWQAVKGEKATCTEDGKEMRVCADDPSHTEIRDVEAYGHTLEGDYISSVGGHWQLCSVCGERGSVNEHNPNGPATAESASVCVDCGYEIAPKLPHAQW